MAGKDLDNLAKGLAEGRVSRGRALKLFAAGLAATALGGLTGTASAAPRTCLTCVCGVGRPCNPKSQVCTTQRAFPSPAAACQAACREQGFKFCGGVSQFHCPHGCP